MRITDLYPRDLWRHTVLPVTSSLWAGGDLVTCPMLQLLLSLTSSTDVADHVTLGLVMRGLES